MQKIENFNLGFFIAEIRRQYIKLENYFIFKSNIDHSDKCRYDVCINKKDKIIYLFESNDTEFNLKGTKKEYYTIKTHDYLIRCEFIIANSNLWQTGFRDIVEKYKEMAIDYPNKPLTILDVPLEYFNQNK